MSAAPWRLGLTATPERSDGRHAEYVRLIGPVVYELPLAAVRGATLANYDVVRIPIFLSRDEQTRYESLSRGVRRYVAERRKAQSDFGWKELCADTGNSPQARRALRAYHAKRAIEDRAEEKLRVLEDLFRLHAGSRTIVFTGSNAMAREVSRRFLIPCLLSHCGKKERLEVLRGFEEGGYPALVANQVLDEGVDLPAAKVAIVIGGSGSTKQAKQRLGRVLRKSGHERATLYEVVCAGTNEERRSRRRRRSDAYQGTRHRRI
jgi:superfamily II DNA or RNA helicase